MTGENTTQQDTKGVFPFDRDIHIWGLSLTHIGVGCVLILKPTPSLVTDGFALGYLLIALGLASYFGNLVEGFYDN